MTPVPPWPQSIDFGRLRRAFEASTRGAAAAGPPPQPVRGVASLRTAEAQPGSSQRLVGLRHIAEVRAPHGVVADVAAQVFVLWSSRVPGLKQYWCSAGDSKPVDMLGISIKHAM